MISILMVCGNGCGSSLVCQMAVEAVLNELGVKANIDHSDMLSAASKHAEILIAGILDFIIDNILINASMVLGLSL